MRTDLQTLFSRTLIALAVAAGGALALPATGAAQADTMVAEAATTPDALAEPAQARSDEELPVRDSGDRVSIFGGSRTIEAGESVLDVLIVGGSLDVYGEVRGDAVVVGGNINLRDSGRIRGDVVVAGGRFRNHGGEVGGEVRSVNRVAGVTGGETQEASRATRTERRGSSPFGRIGQGFAGLISTIALGVVLAAVGATLIFYGFRYLENVSDTLRASTMRSGGVGLAATFLIVPAFVVLIVALAVSIVGIPVLLLAIPLYPLAVAAAMIFGLIAAAYAIGERTSEQRGYELRHRNAYAYLATGLVILFAPVMMGHLVGMTPFLGWLGGLIKFFSYALIWVATIAGLGAVMLSRAGTRRTFARRPALPADDPILDEDPFLERSDV